MSCRVVFYEDEDGHKVVREWLDSLPSPGKKKVLTLIERLKLCGSKLVFPTARYLRYGLWELRDHHSKGPGYRVYYTFVTMSDGTLAVAVLLVGGTKATQEQDIVKARDRQQVLKASTSDGMG